MGPDDSLRPKEQQASAPAPSILQLATGFWASQALYVAAKLGMADFLADGPKPVEALAADAGLNAQALYRLLRTLAGVGVFAEDEQGHFRNTTLSKTLETNAPGSLRPFVIMLGEPESWRAWGELLHSVRTGRPAFEYAFGVPLFDYFAAHPEPARIFDEAMASRSAAEIETVLDVYDFSDAGRIVDVGGGNGALLTAILETHPHAEGILFELPTVIERARVTLSGHPAVSRLRFEEGDFFDAVPSGGDVYLLKKIIHNWEDDRAEAILRACRRAMARDSRLLLIELVVPPGNEASFAKLLDLFMLVWPGGRERTEDEHRKILGAAWLSLTRIVPTKSPVSIIETAPV
jgi:hypothetical protein